MSRFLFRGKLSIVLLLFSVSCGTIHHHGQHASGMGQPSPIPSSGESKSTKNSLRSTPSRSTSPSPDPGPQSPTANSLSPTDETSTAVSTTPPSEIGSDYTDATSPSNSDESAQTDSEADQDSQDQAADADSTADDTTIESAPDSSGDQEDEPTYDVPIVLNDSVEDYIQYFQTEIRDRFTLWLERSGRYIPTMRQIFKEQGLPEDLVFVALIESGFNPYAYSRSRAVGHWQFIKGTGRLYGLRIDNWIDERRDPIKSTRAAAHYLKDLYDRFGSWPLAMAGYNAGERKISRALIKAKADDFWDLRSTRYIRRETKGYVPKFMAATIIAKNPERYGFTLDYHEPLQFDTVTVPGSADLRIIAQAAGVTYDQIKELNPELRTELTPPYMQEYAVRLPVGTKDAFAEAYSQIPDDQKVIGTHYSVNRNDTLAKIARRFGTSSSLLREINHLERGHVLHVGDEVFIPKIRSVPREPERRVASSKSRSRIHKKKEPIQMASAESQEKTDTPEDGTKILYLVKDGDTLWDISRSFNVSVHDLKKYNGLGKHSTIRPGDQLVLGFQSKDL